MMKFKYVLLLIFLIIVVYANLGEKPLPTSQDNDATSRVQLSIDDVLKRIESNGDQKIRRFKVERGSRSGSAHGTIVLEAQEPRKAFILKIRENIKLIKGWDELAPYDEKFRFCREAVQLVIDSSCEVCNPAIDLVLLFSYVPARGCGAVRLNNQ